MSPAPPPAWPRFAVAGLVFAAIFYATSRTIADPDLWGHIRFGQDILDSGTIPDTDPYSYLSGGHLWINHEWLTHVILAAVFGALGAPGLIALKVALILLTLGLVYRSLCRHGLDPLRAGMVVLGVMFLMSVGLATIRPQLFTYLGFALVLLLIEKAERGESAALWAMPAIFLPWANLHGGFLVGLGVLAFWTAAHLALRWRRPTEHSAGAPRPSLLLAVLLASLAAVLINPWGFEMIAFLLPAATLPRPEIGEWGSISLASRGGLAYLVVLGVALLAVAASRRPRNMALLAVFACTAVAPLLALRHLPLFALAFGILAGEHLADAWQRWSPRAPSNDKNPLLPALALVAALVFAALGVSRFQCILFDPTFMRLPVRAVALLKQAGVEGNLATFFDWGEYIIWALGPRVQVSIDGRRESVYPDEAYERNLAFTFGAGDWAAVLEDASMALVQRDQPSYNLLKLQPGWELVYEDSLAGLFAREGSPQADLIRTAPPPDLPADGAGLCFP
jgi:hypothetical protein